MNDISHHVFYPYLHVYISYMLYTHLKYTFVNLIFSLNVIISKRNENIVVIIGKCM